MERSRKIEKIKDKIRFFMIYLLLFSYKVMFVFAVDGADSLERFLAVPDEHSRKQISTWDSPLSDICPIKCC